MAYTLMFRLAYHDTVSKGINRFLFCHFRRIFGWFVHDVYVTDHRKKLHACVCCFFFIYLFITELIITLASFCCQAARPWDDEPRHACNVSCFTKTVMGVTSDPSVGWIEHTKDRVPVRAAVHHSHRQNMHALDRVLCPGKTAASDRYDNY